MSKRFTDTEKFSDTWYRKLSLLHKVIWEYLLAECNHAGILENFDLEMMSFKIGAEVTKEDLQVFENRIIFISDDILFIPKFIQFQYGELNPQSKVHASVLRELEKYNIDTLSIEYGKSYQTLKDKDKNKDKDKDKNIINPDFYFSDSKQKVFDIYKQICTNLIAISFEPRNKRVLDKVNAYLNEINNDFEQYKLLCEKANKLQKIADTRIDFEMMLNCYIGIMNGKYESEKPMTALERKNQAIKDYFAQKRLKEQQNG